MKKIISVALVASVVAGLATADAKITLNWRQQGTAWDWTKKTETPKVGDETTTSTVDWVNFNSYGGSADSFKFVFSGDMAGATLELNPDYTGGNISIKQYNAFVKFGDLTLSGGKWGDGFADGGYRVKKDVDAMNANGQDFERFKLGSMFTASPSKYMDDLTKSNAVSGVAEYSLGLNDDMKLNLALAAFDNAFDTVKDEDGNDTTTTNYKAGWSARAQFNMSGLFNSEFIVRKENSKTNAFGLYFQPTMVDGLTATIGGALAMQKNGGKDKDGKTDDEVFWNVDLRLRYQVMDPLSITFFTNISGATSDGGQKIGSGLAGIKGGDGWANSAVVKMAMWNNLSARYKINDTFTATLNLGLITALAGSDLKTEEKADNGIEWRVTPAVQIYANSASSIWIGFAFSGSSWTDKTEKDISLFSIALPVVFRVKM